jgi:phospholipid/cholesterol/gamma-HCH transport system substrate-binding protein
MQLRYPLLGLTGVAAFVGMVALCVALYGQAFLTSVPVTVLADRSGLLMESGAAVKLNGVVVGQVSDVSTDGAGARIGLALQPRMVGHIPADVSAQIVPPTVFGAKYVSLVPPANTGHFVGRPIAAGAVIDRSQVTVEINGTFEQILLTLNAMPAAKLNEALGAVAGTLDGRGAQLGTVLVKLDAYLRQFNPSLPALTADLPRAAATADLYADITPDLVRTLDNTGAVSDTLVDQQAQLGAFLLSLTHLGDQTADVLHENEDAIPTTLDTLRPTSRLLGQYSPILPCLLAGVVNNDTLLRAVMGGPAMGGTHRDANVLFSVERSQPAYQYPADLPKIGASNPPNCYGLPAVHGAVPHQRFNSGADPYPTDHEGVTLGQVPIGVALFGDTFPLNGTQPAVPAPSAAAPRGIAPGPAGEHGGHR